MKKLDWVVYWTGDIPTATWVTRKKAQALADNPEIKITTWLRA